MTSLPTLIPYSLLDVDPFSYVFILTLFGHMKITFLTVYLIKFFGFLCFYELDFFPLSLFPKKITFSLDYGSVKSYFKRNLSVGHSGTRL